ncbi:SH3 domain-containing protein, partial [Paraburkholderia bengalensis]
MRIRVACAAAAWAAGLSIVSCAALAQTEAYTSTSAYLYAGPAQDYPIVAQLPAGQPVTVYGCVSGYSWCDVAIPQARGWVYGGYLTYPYQGSNVPLMNYGTAIGLPLVTFSLGAYWGSYYRGRPWYNDRSRWEHHPPRNRPPPPPGHPPGAGPNRPPTAPPPGEIPRPLGADHGHRPGPRQPPPPESGVPGAGQPPMQGGRPSGPPPGQTGQMGQPGQPPHGQPPAQGAGRPPTPQAPPAQMGGRPPSQPPGRAPGQGGGARRPAAPQGT